jgi:hypothetical protein
MIGSVQGGGSRALSDTPQLTPIHFHSIPNSMSEKLDVMDGGTSFRQSIMFSTTSDLSDMPQVRMIHIDAISLFITIQIKYFISFL